MTNKEAISNLNHIYGIVSPDIQRSLDLAIKALEERPQGKWIYDYKTCKCSVCNFTTVIDTYNYCPNCGADMRGNNKETTFDDYLKEQLKDHEFRKEWNKLRDEDMRKGDAEV